MVVFAQMSKKASILQLNGGVQYPIPVSYTHLDVYKRQPPYPPMMRTRTKTDDTAANTAPSQDNTADAIRAACTVACTVCRANWRAPCFCEALLGAPAIPFPLLKNAEERCASLNSTPFVRQYGKLLTNGVLFYAKRGFLNTMEHLRNK